MPKKFEINRTKIKGVCQSGRKVAIHNSKIDLPLVTVEYFLIKEKYFFEEITSVFRFSVKDGLTFYLIHIPIFCTYHHIHIKPQNS